MELVPKLKLQYLEYSSREGEDVTGVSHNTCLFQAPYPCELVDNLPSLTNQWQTVTQSNGVAPDRYANEAGGLDKPNTAQFKGVRTAI